MNTKTKIYFSNKNIHINMASLKPKNIKYVSINEGGKKNLYSSLQAYFNSCCEKVGQNKIMYTYIDYYGKRYELEETDFIDVYKNIYLACIVNMPDFIYIKQLKNIVIKKHENPLHYRNILRKILCIDDDVILDP